MSPNSTVLQCSLVKSSYKVDFNFTNGEQNISTARYVFDPYQSIDFLNMVYGPSETCNNLTLTLRGPGNGKRICEFDESLLGRLSYRAMLDAFLGVVGGNIGVSAEKMIADSNIVNTVLINSYELNFITDYELAPEALPKTNVSFVTYHNVYIYAEGRLWLAYGVAIFFATSAVGIGLHAVFANGVSYSNDFTTVLRVTRHAIVDIDVSSRDNGSDPLPRELADVKFTTSVGKQDRDAEEQSLDDASVANEPKQGLVSERLLSEEGKLRVGSGGRFSTW